MKSIMIALWLVTYPACGDAIYEFVTGPFAAIEVCEQYKEMTIKRKGPPSPGTIYRCEIR